MPPRPRQAPTSRDITSKQFGDVISSRAGVFARLFYFPESMTKLSGMKPFLYCTMGAVILLAAGCDQKSETPVVSTNNTNSATSPLNAPAGYLGALVKGQQAAVKTIDTASLDKAIQLFEAANGRNPKDLNELVEQKFIGKIPETPYGTKLVYDPAAGTVKVVNSAP
jgi:hypothetical protein